MSLSDNIDFLRRLPKMPGLNGLARETAGNLSPLIESNKFGANPGDLRMFSFVPDHLPPKPALVVVLHGCTQNAADYDVGAGWSALAERYGFVLLMPQQKSSNNGNGCFNWFNTEDITRDGGEALSIREMVAHLVAAEGIDERRVFVTGLSAGGAMASVMLATYPEVFAGGAIIAGLPYGIAHTMQDALGAMYRASPHPAKQLGDLVRNASTHKGPWPKISVWHGSADRTVNCANATEIVKQWLDVHGLPQTAMSEAPVDGYPRQVWWNGDGETIVESYAIAHLAHGTPLGIGGDDERYGAEGPFLIEAGISSSWHIAQFFGLTKALHAPKASAGARPAANAVASSAVAIKTSMPNAGILVAAEPAAMPEAVRMSSGAQKPRAEADRRFTSRANPGRRSVDINAVIARALTAAGLIKP